MFSDNNLSSISQTVENPLVMLARNGPVILRTKMTKGQFHQFLLAHEGLKIERDKHGTITIHPLMTYKSSTREAKVCALLTVWAMLNDTGQVTNPSGAVDLPDGSTHKADGAWFSKAKDAQLSPEEQETIPQLVPDFLIETRSKTDSLPKLKKKMEEVWMANGVNLAWLIDPISEKVWIYRPGRPVEEVPNFDTTLSDPVVLPGFELNLKLLK